jgi:site-specific DNA recombinase
MSSKAALYVRVSSDEQAAKGTSLSTQEERLREFCGQNGIIVAGVYCDDGYSGATLDRPRLQQMLQDARRNLFSRILVYKLDRLSRNLKDAVNLVLGDLKEAGIEFQSITEPFNTLDPSGRIMFGNLAIFADFEREQIRERCCRGRAMRNREGKFTGGQLPYGITWNRQTNAYETVEDEARIYRRIFDLYVIDKQGLAQIAHRLKEEGCVTRKGMSFAPRQIRFLLESPAATGKWNRHRIVTRTSSNPLVQRKLQNPIYDKRGERPREEWITICVPPIVPREIWDRAQERLASRCRATRTVHPALCQGVIFCGKCGSRLGLRGAKRRGKTYRWYQCYARLYKADRRYRHYKGHGCDMPSVSQAELDSIVWAKIEEMVVNPAVLWDAVYGGGDRNKQESLSRRADSLRRQLRQAKVQEDRAARLFTLGADPKTAERQVKEVAARRRALEQELAQAEKAARLEDARQDLKEKAFGALISLRDRVGDLSPEEKRHYLRLFIPGGLTHRIELHGDGTVLMRGLLDFVPAKGVPYPAESYFS